MSRRGVFGIDRGVWEHSFFKREPFTELQAWFWLISEAAWKGCRRKRGGVHIELRRGQLAHPIRFMADAWGWHRARVERFLNRLKTETMIETHAETGVTVVTICKYENYQRVALPDETNGEPSAAKSARQERDRLEEGKETKNSFLRKGAERASNVIPIDHDAPADAKAVLFSEAKPWLLELGKTKDSAGRVIGRWLKEAHDDAGLVLGIVREARSRNLADPVAWVMGAIKERDERRERERNRFLWGRQ